MTAPDIVVQLIQRFQSQLPDYRAGRYNETQLADFYESQWGMGIAEG